MGKKQNPFSLYDFLGYFIPGALSIFIFIILLNLHRCKFNIINYFTIKCGFSRPELYLLFVILSYTIGHLFSYVSSVTVERYSIWRYNYPSKYLLNFPTAEYFNNNIKIKNIVIRFLVLILVLPIAVWDVICVKLFKIRESYPSNLDPLLRQLIWGKIDKLIGDKSGIKNLRECGEPVDHDFFRFAYHYTLENAPAHQDKFQNYVALYGYMRTITLIGIFLSWWVIILGIRLKVGMPLSIILILGVSLVSYMFFLGFIKFYRRFTLEVLMALSVIYN